MTEQTIFHHEDGQGLSLVEFLRAIWVQRQGSPLPGIESKSGKILARVNQGRWIAECPNVWCGNAIVASVKTPLYICTSCGSRENDQRWYLVEFPARKREIEAELLKRPAARSVEARNRNWSPGETEATLRRERVLHERGLA